MKRAFAGSWVALATPFREGQLDLDAWRAGLERQRAGGTDGVVVGGTTGEGATLADDERAALYAEAERVGLPWLASVGTSATASTIELARRAAAAGAHGLLVATPGYSRPSQPGLLAHFRAVAAATERPLVLYDVPARSAVSLETATILELAEHPNIVALKDAGGALDRVRELAGALTLLWGDDATLEAALARGAQGAISVLGNLFPREVQRLIAGQAPAPAHFAAWNELLYLESNPAPLKHVLARLELDAGELRLPLVPVGDEARKRLDRQLTSQTRAGASNPFGLDAPASV